MKTWKIFLKFSDGTTVTLDLFDASQFFNGYLKIKRSYFSSLIKAVKMTRKYTTGRAIEEIKGPEGDDWTYNPWILLNVIDNEKEKPFWFLIKRETDLTGLLIAIGPKPFVDYNIVNATEAKRDIKRLINYIIAYLNKFNCTILLPNYLS